MARHMGLTFVKCNMRAWLFHILQMGAMLIAIPGLAAGASPLHLVGECLPPLPDALGVAGPFAGVSGGALLVAGGANFPHGFPWEGGQKMWHDEIYVLPQGATNWLTGFKLPRPLAYGVSLPFDDGVLCLGGNDAGCHHREVFLLRWRAGRVLIETNFPSLPQALANACGTVCAGCVYIVGGETAPNATRAEATVWHMNPAAGNAVWRRAPDCPGSGRTLALAATAGTRVCVFGGVKLSARPDGKPARRYLADAYALASGGRVWTRLHDLPHPLAAAPGPAPLVGAGWLALLGGDDGSRYGFQPIAKHPGFSHEVLLYHPGNDVWQSGGAIAAPRATVPAVMWNGKIIVPGGEARPGVRSPEVRAYTIEAP